MKKISAFFLTISSLLLLTVSISLAGGVDIYNDLGTGERYHAGSDLIIEDITGKELNLTLSEQAISDLNAADNYFAIGITFRYPISPTEWVIFGEGSLIINQNIVIDATDKGTFREDGSHQPSDLTTRIGYVDNKLYNVFYLFDLNSLTDIINSVSLKIKVIEIQSPISALAFDLYDVSPAIVNELNSISFRNVPSAPALLFPQNGSFDLSVTPILQVNLFSDPDPGDVHQKTEWQISTSISFNSLVLYESGDKHLTSLPVPDLSLEENTIYYWRARFYDSGNNVSAWSNTYSFTTLSTQNDQDNDGVPDTLQNESVDLNNDGTPDDQQDNVKSLNAVTGDGQVGVSIDSSSSVTSIERINSIDPQTISRYSRPESMPLGLFAVKAEVANPGDTARLTIHFSTPAPENAGWYFYDPINSWTDFSQNAEFSQDRKSITLQLQDGGIGDSDGIANGIIVDPSGFGIASWIKGTVTDASTGTTLSTATILIKEVDLLLKSLSDGSYVSMVLPGTYDMTVSAPGYQSMDLEGVELAEASILTKDIALTASTTNNCAIKAQIKTEEKGYIDGVWKQGGEDTTARGDRVVWGYFYANPNEVSWGNSNNPEVYVKVWYDASGRVDANFFHVSVPDIEVFSEYSNLALQGTSTMNKRYIRLYYNDNNVSGKSENIEDGVPATGYDPNHSPKSYITINNLSIGAAINTVEAVGSIDAIWKQGGTAVTKRGDEVVWGYFYADPNDVSWGSQNNPELFVKLWFDVSGRIDVNYFHVSVPDIEIYSDYGSDGAYDNKGTTIMDDRYIRHEYTRQ